MNYFDLIKSLNKKQIFHSGINKQFLRIRVILISRLFQHLFSFRLAWEGAKRTGRTKNRPRTSLRIRLNSDMMPTLSQYQYKWQSCFFKCAHNYDDRFLIKISHKPFIRDLFQIHHFHSNLLLKQIRPWMTYSQRL